MKETTLVLFQLFLVQETREGGENVLLKVKQNLFCVGIKGWSKALGQVFLQLEEAL